MKQLITLTVLMALVSATASFANEHVKMKKMSIDNRVERQKGRVAKKLENGKIDQTQADQLNKNVDAVAAKKQELKSDGKLSKEDRKSLQQDLNKNSEAIKAAGKKE